MVDGKYVDMTKSARINAEEKTQYDSQWTFPYFVKPGFWEDWERKSDKCQWCLSAFKNKKEQKNVCIQMCF